MTKVVDSCCWCHKFVTQPKGFDAKKGIIVCSDECMRMERGFRLHFSDGNIGLRNMSDFGVNPNDRGKNGKGKKASN